MKYIVGYYQIGDTINLERVEAPDALEALLTIQKLSDALEDYRASAEDNYTSFEGCKEVLENNDIYADVIKVS